MYLSGDKKAEYHTLTLSLPRQTWDKLKALEYVPDQIQSFVGQVYFSVPEGIGNQPIGKSMEKMGNTS